MQPAAQDDRAVPKPAALATACSILMAAASGLGTALNAHDLGWWSLFGVAIALSFAANLKGVLHPVLRVLALLAQFTIGALIVFSVPVLMMAESGASLPWWVWPLAMTLLAACAVATLAGVQALRRERSRTVRNGPVQHALHQTIVKKGEPQ